MKSLPKIFLTLCLITAVLAVAMPIIAHAQPQTLENLKNVGGQAYGTTGEPKPIAQIVGGIIQNVLTLLGVGAVILMIYAGYLWMTARGKEERVTKAKDTMEAAVIGLIIILAAYSISYYVVKWIASSAR